MRFLFSKGMDECHKCTYSIFWTISKVWLHWYKMGMDVFFIDTNVSIFVKKIFNLKKCWRHQKSHFFWWICQKKFSEHHNECPYQFSCFGHHLQYSAKIFPNCPHYMICYRELFCMYQKENISIQYCCENVATTGKMTL